jgi:hypothetical protein
MKMGAFVDGISPNFLGRVGVLRLRRTMRFAHRPAPFRMTLYEFCDLKGIHIFRTGGTEAQGRTKAAMANVAMAFGVSGVSAQGRFVKKVMG